MHYPPRVVQANPKLTGSLKSSKYYILEVPLGLNGGEGPGRRQGVWLCGPYCLDHPARIIATLTRWALLPRGHTPTSQPGCEREALGVESSVTTGAVADGRSWPLGHAE
eukprot:scaffold783_cov471-Prasinococcus_capsulatus_cf.AAC.1